MCSTAIIPLHISYSFFPLAIMATFLRRLVNAAPALRSNAFGGQSKIHSSKYRFPIGAIAAVSGGISYMYYVSSSDLVIQLDFRVFLSCF